jgi:DNA-binding MarR family transcriptional regulator
MTGIRTLPLRLPVADGESLDSWIEALARRYRIAPRAMLRVMGAGQPSGHVSSLLEKSSPAIWERAEHAAGLAPGRLRIAAGAHLAPVSRLRSRGSRFCPSCLAGNGGRWQLAWRLNWTLACPQHHLLLAGACPVCLAPPRVRMPGGTTSVDAATCACAATGSRRRCGADLTRTPAGKATASDLGTQRWIDTLIADLAGPHAAAAKAVLADLPAVTSWLARSTAAGQEPRTHRGYGKVPRASARLTADLLTQARVLLTGGDQAAVTALRAIITALPTGERNPPPGMDFHHWKSLHPVFPSRYLQAADQDLYAVDRLRMKTVTTTAARPGTGRPQRSRMLPQMLWPDWTARLLPVTGFMPDLFRAVMSACVLIPGSANRSLAAIAAPLNPRLTSSHISGALQGIADISGEASLRPVLILLCRLAEYLDTCGCPIDYQRRRDIAPAEPMTWQHWRDLACSTGSHPGDQVATGRVLHAQRHLHQLLTGNDLADKRHPLAFRDAVDRSRYLDFATSLTPSLRRALRQDAARILARHGIDEPVTWSPPAGLAGGLTLPGTDTGSLDLATIKRIVIDQQRPARDAAQALNVNIEHIRLALDRLDRPQRHWAGHAVPSSWQREQEAAQLLTREFFEREYVATRRSLREISTATGFTKETVTRHARGAGITIARAAPRTIKINERWLREQYCRHRRSTSDIAAETGATQMTVLHALERMGIQLRPSGVASHPEMIKVLDGRMPRDIRAAVEGGLKGWQRLHRFQIAMAFPSLATATGYLGLPPSGLTAQFQRLEADIGGQLFSRSAPGRPHKPTPRGKALLKALDRPHIKALITETLSKHPRTLPDAHALTAATRQFHQARKNPGPLAPFDGISVERIRITTSTTKLLRDLVEHGSPQFYGHEVIGRTGLDGGTIYPSLRRLEKAGWLTSWPEDEQEWLAGAPPGRGPGRRRTYFTLTPEGRRAALREIEDHPIPKPRKVQNP